MLRFRPVSCNNLRMSIVIVAKQSKTMKEIKQSIALIMLALALPFVSVAHPAVRINDITGNNHVITQNRTVTPYHAIKVSGGIDVELMQGKELKLQVEADENLVPLIRTDVKDGVLNIYHDENIRNAKTLKVHLTFKDIDAITASGGCDIVSKQKLGFSKLRLDLSGGCDIKLDCKAGKLDCVISGGCDAVFTGEAENCTINASGGCDVKASQLYLNNCTVDASGGSDVEINVKGELNMKASGASDITYTGKPAKVMQSSHGASEIHGR